MSIGIFPALLACASIGSMSKSDMAELIQAAPTRGMAPFVERYSTDRRSLDRLYTIEESPRRQDRLEDFYTEWRRGLDQIAFDQLSVSDRADWVMLRNVLDYELQTLEIERKKLEEAWPLMPFADTIIQLHESRRDFQIPDGETTASTLAQLAKDVAAARRDLEGRLRSEKAEEIAPEHVARRAIETLGRLDRTFREWHEYFTGYDPMFTWWTAKPYADADAALDAYRKLLGDRLAAGSEAADAILGDPIGADALRVDLDHEMIPYTPEELIEIANKEMEWCRAEMVKAARELGLGDDWRAALEMAKEDHVAPGEQPALIRELAVDAIRYLEEHDLVTIPEMAKELWRMEMMSPERQLQSPFFLGGESIIVSFPTDTMSHEQKLMSLRSNNRNYAMATVHHELIPGHHLQGYMNARYNTHRGPFRTPFWTEGWALYWEFLLYKRNYPATPLQKMGFLFWRSHRCARIVFSLSFHLGRMTADECVDLLESIGHERSTAEGEVRRSLYGNYPPLYQAAYMLGALQMWTLRREVVDGGIMGEKEFHDQVLQNNNMPFAVLRAILKGEKLEKDFESDWRFYTGSS